MSQKSSVMQLPQFVPKALTSDTDKTMATVLPSTGIREHVPGNLAQSDSIIELRYGNNPASEVTLEPWNSSFSRRSKSSLRTPSFDSPIG